MEKRERSQEKQAVTRGWIFLSNPQAELLRRRGSALKISLSETIRQIIEPTIERILSEEPDEQERISAEYRKRIAAKLDQDTSNTTLRRIEYVLPKSLVDSLNTISHNSLLNDELLYFMLRDELIIP